MEKYIGVVKEIYKHEYEVKAVSKDEALQKIKNLHDMVFDNSVNVEMEIDFTLTDKEKEIILKLCECSMNISMVSKVMYVHRNTVTYYIEKMKEKYGLDPLNFYDLIKLRKMCI